MWWNGKHNPDLPGRPGLNAGIWVRLPPFAQNLICMDTLEQLNKAMVSSRIGPTPPPGWKPTHVTTYGENAKGEFCAYTTDLATNETEVVVLSPIKWSPDDIKLWQSVPK